MENKYKVTISGDLDSVQVHDSQGVVDNGWWLWPFRPKQDFMKQSYVVLNNQPWDNLLDVAIATTIRSFVTEAEWILVALENM